MATALLVAAIMAGGIAVAYQMQEDQIQISPENDEIPAPKQRTLALQREWGYAPGQFAMASNTHNFNRLIPRIKGSGADIDPASIADAYTGAFAQRVQESTAQAMRKKDYGIVVSSSRAKPPLYTPASSANQGAMASYPLSYFEVNGLKDPIETRQDIFDDPYPSTFTGPHNDKYPLASAPDRLRNPWQADGAYFAEYQESRKPSIYTRPAHNDPNPTMFPHKPHPWARRVGQ